MRKKKIAVVLGTRPEMIKLSPLISKLDKAFKLIIIHTGQHYSKGMNKTIWEDLKLRKANYNLLVGSHKSEKQISLMVERLEKVLKKEKPDAVLVQGDTNSTLSGALAAKGQNIKVIHIESGARSGDINAPEEVNRILVDHMSYLNFCFDQESEDNIKSEGIKRNIFNYHNTAYEACKENFKISEKSKILTKLKLQDTPYILVTIHRQDNADDPKHLKKIGSLLNHIAKNNTVLFPVHPRTKKRIKSLGVKLSSNIKTVAPMGYIDFLKVLSKCKYAISDSGGVVDESVTLNIPLFILRNVTERNEIVGAKKAHLVPLNQSLASMIKKFERLTTENNLLKMKKVKLKIDYNVSKKIIGVISKRL